MIWDIFLIIFFMGGWFTCGGFDWVFDMMECINYIEVCELCEKYLFDKVDYATWDRWQYSMLNKYYGDLNPFQIYKLNEDYYLDFVTMMQEYTKHDHTGMYSFICSDRYSGQWVQQFKIWK